MTKPKGMGWAQRRGHGSQFTAKMEKAVAALTTHRTIEEAAQAVGISLSTLKRWMREPEFQAAYREARREAMEQTTARLQQFAEGAVTVLLKAIADSSTPASVRVRAADRILWLAQRAMTLEGLALRIAEIERRLREDNVGGRPAGGISEAPVRQPHGHRPLPHKLEAAASALMMHRKIEDAAQAAAISVSTLQRWKKLPEFQEVWMAARRSVMFQASARLQKNVAVAGAVLCQVMAGDSKPAVKVRAATCLLQHAYQALQEEDLENKVAALERAMSLRDSAAQSVPMAA